MIALARYVIRKLKEAQSEKALAARAPAAPSQPGVPIYTSTARPASALPVVVATGEPYAGAYAIPVADKADAAAAPSRGSPASVSDYDDKYGVRGDRQLGGHHFLKLFLMARTADARRIASLPMTINVSVTIFIIGVVFIALAASGTYPTTVVNQKLLGQYGVNIAKYSIYIAAGVLGVLGGWLGSKAVAHRSSVLLSATLIGLAMLCGLATLGMTAYTIDKEATSPYYTTPWWSWLITAIIIIQRLLFVWVCALGLTTLLEARGDMHVMCESRV